MYWIYQYAAREQQRLHEVLIHVFIGLELCGISLGERGAVVALHHVNTHIRAHALYERPVIMRAPSHCHSKHCLQIRFGITGFKNFEGLDV